MYPKKTKYPKNQFFLNYHKDTYVPLYEINHPTKPPATLKKKFFFHILFKTLNILKIKNL